MTRPVPTFGASMMQKSIRQTLPQVINRRGVSRRALLRGAGIMLALPMLDAMLPALSSVYGAESPISPNTKPRRMLAICNNLGLLPDQFFPKVGGKGYEHSPYTQLLDDHRDDFTIFS